MPRAGRRVSLGSAQRLEQRRQCGLLVGHDRRARAEPLEDSVNPAVDDRPCLTVERLQFRLRVVP